MLFLISFLVSPGLLLQTLSPCSRLELAKKRQQSLVDIDLKYRVEVIGSDHLAGETNDYETEAELGDEPDGWYEETYIGDPTALESDGDVNYYETGVDWGDTSDWGDASDWGWDSGWDDGWDGSFD